MEQCGAVWCSVVQCGAVWCSVVQCGAVWCSVEQCGAVWSSVEQCGAVWSSVVRERCEVLSAEKQYGLRAAIQMYNTPVHES